MKEFQHIADKINGIISEEFEVDMDRMVPGANFRQVLSLDSLDYVDLTALLENNFYFKVKPEDFTHVVTFHDLHEYIISHAEHIESGA